MRIFASMKRTILIITAVVVGIALIALTTTKPDRRAHYDAVKMSALKVVDHELSSNPLTAEYTTLGTMKALDMIDDYLQRNLILREHTFYTMGILIYQDMFIPISVGVLGQVYLTVDEHELKKLAEIPEIKKMTELPEIRQMLEKYQKMK